MTIALEFLKRKSFLSIGIAVCLLTIFCNWIPDPRPVGNEISLPRLDISRGNSVNSSNSLTSPPSDGVSQAISEQGPFRLIASDSLDVPIGLTGQRKRSSEASEGDADHQPSGLVLEIPSPTGVVDEVEEKVAEPGSSEIETTGIVEPSQMSSGGIEPKSDLLTQTRDEVDVLAKNLTGLKQEATGSTDETSPVVESSLLPPTKYPTTDQAAEINQTPVLRSVIEFSFLPTANPEGRREINSATPASKAGYRPFAAGNQSLTGLGDQNKTPINSGGAFPVRGNTVIPQPASQEANRQPQTNLLKQSTQSLSQNEDKVVANSIQNGAPRRGGTAPPKSRQSLISQPALSGSAGIESADEQPSVEGKDATSAVISKPISPPRQLDNSPTSVIENGIVNDSSRSELALSRSPAENCLEPSSRSNAAGNLLRRNSRLCMTSSDQWVDTTPRGLSIEVSQLFLSRDGADDGAFIYDGTTNDVVLRHHDLDSASDDTSRYKLQYQSQSGYRFEFIYFDLDDVNHSETVGNSVPVFFGESPAMPSSAYDLNYDSSLTNFEFNAWRRISQNFRYGFGLRHVALDEAFNVLTSGTPNGYFSDTQNELWGGQFVAEYARPICRGIDLEIGSRVGLFKNEADINFVTPTRDVAYEDSESAAVVDLNLGLSVKFSCRFRLRGGYQVMYMDGVALAPNQSTGYSPAATIAPGNFSEATYDGGYFGAAFSF